jgi:hypothetical protein
VFSYSELEDIRQCPEKWLLRWQERWVPPVDTEEQSRGKVWHQMMATFYGLQMSGTSWAKAYKATREQYLIPARGGQMTELEELLDWMFKGYAQHWHHDAQDWTVLAGETFYVAPVLDWWHLKVKPDLIVKLRGSNRLWLVDHKTSKNMLKPGELQLHSEFLLYTWALRKMGFPIWGTIYDGARAFRYKDPNKPQALEDRFERILIHHTQEQLEVTARDALRDLASVSPLTKNNTDRSRHLDPDRCRWRCPFLDPCLAGFRADSYDVTRRYLQDLGFQKEERRHT